MKKLLICGALLGLLTSVCVAQRGRVGPTPGTAPPMARIGPNAVSMSPSAPISPTAVSHGGVAPNAGPRANPVGTTTVAPNAKTAVAPNARTGVAAEPVAPDARTVAPDAQQ